MSALRKGSNALMKECIARNIASFAMVAENVWLRQERIPVNTAVFVRIVADFTSATTAACAWRIPLTGIISVRIAALAWR